MGRNQTFYRNYGVGMVQYHLYHVLYGGDADAFNRGDWRVYWENLSGDETSAKVFDYGKNWRGL